MMMAYALSFHRMARREDVTFLTLLAPSRVPLLNIDFFQLNHAARENFVYVVFATEGETFEVAFVVTVVSALLTGLVQRSQCGKTKTSRESVALHCSNLFATLCNAMHAGQTKEKQEKTSCVRSCSCSAPANASLLRRSRSLLLYIACTQAIGKYCMRSVQCWLCSARSSPEQHNSATRALHRPATPRTARLVSLFLGEDAQRRSLACLKLKFVNRILCRVRVGDDAGKRPAAVRVGY